MISSENFARERHAKRVGCVTIMRRRSPEPKSSHDWNCDASSAEAEAAAASTPRESPLLVLSSSAEAEEAGNARFIVSLKCV